MHFLYLRPLFITNKANNWGVMGHILYYTVYGKSRMLVNLFSVLQIQTVNFCHWYGSNFRSKIKNFLQEPCIFCKKHAFFIRNIGFQSWISYHENYFLCSMYSKINCWEIAKNQYNFYNLQIGLMPFLFQIKVFKRKMDKVVETAPD